MQREAKDRSTRTTTSDGSLRRLRPSCGAPLIVGGTPRFWLASGCVSGAVSMWLVAQFPAPLTGRLPAPIEIWGEFWS